MPYIAIFRQIIGFQMAIDYETEFVKWDENITTFLTAHKEVFDEVKQIDEQKAADKEAKTKLAEKVKNKASYEDDAKTLPFLELGKILYQANENLNKKLFSELKQKVAAQLGKSGMSNINKVYRIAENQALHGYFDRLPKGWGTLSIVASLKPKELEVLMEDESITPDITREELTKRVRIAQGYTPKPKPIIIEMDSEDAESIEKVEDILKRSGWKIVRPAEKKVVLSEEDS